MKPFADKVRVTMRYGNAISLGPLMTDADVRHVRATNDNIGRQLLGSPSSGGGSGAVPPRGGFVPSLSGAARRASRGLGSGTPLPGAPNAVAMYVMSAVYMALMVRDLGTAFRNALQGNGGPIVVTPDTPGVPANLLPQGVIYSEGPCQSWGDWPDPVGMLDGAITPCFQVLRDLTTATDAQISTALSSGETVFLNASKVPRYWRDYAWVSNPLAPSDVKWDSSIHGKPNGVPGKDGYPYQLGDHFAKMLERLGYRPPYVDPTSVAPAYSSGRTIVVPMRDFWGWRNNHVDHRVAQGVEPPPPSPPPPRIFDPWRPFQPKLRTVKRYTEQLRRVNRVVGKAGPNKREAKGNIAKAVSNALDVMGALSEVGDDIDAWYKSLPASVRRSVHAELGKSPNFADKLRALYANYDKIDVGKGVAGMITTRVDDMVAATIAQPFDKALQVAVPDYITRLGVRQAIRWAYWKSGAESPIPQAPSSQKFLPEKYRQEPMVTKKHQNY